MANARLMKTEAMVSDSIPGVGGYIIGWVGKTGCQLPINALNDTTLRANMRLTRMTSAMQIL